MSLRPLTSAELLSAWERGQGQPLVTQALVLLSAARPDASLDDLARLSIGRRDAALLALRGQVFGSRLSSVVGCPACGERLELTFDAADIGGESLALPAEDLALTAGEYSVRFRLPDSLDMAAAQGSDARAVRATLIERCVLEARRGDEPVAAGDLPAKVVSAVAHRMAEADPMADIQISLTCPACEHAWQATFDIVSYFWAELHAWAYRLLAEVHTLASAYGWREADILALSPWRRQYYLGMLSG